MSPFWCHRIARVMGPGARVIGPPGDRVLPRRMVSENLRRDGTLAGNPRESFIEAVPRRSAFRLIPAVEAESRRQIGNETGRRIRLLERDCKCRITR
jgi:hypothetical protein